MPRKKADAAAEIKFCIWRNPCENKNLCCHYCKKRTSCITACKDLESGKPCPCLSDTEPVKATVVIEKKATKKTMMTNDKVSGKVKSGDDAGKR